MTAPIIVINPNSTEAVTEGMRAAVSPLVQRANGNGYPDIECVTLPEGPPGIETQVHVEMVVPPLLELIKSLKDQASAFVIGCYSDPGLHAAREVAGVPVFGMAECGLMTAMARGNQVGVISILAGSIARHMRQIRALGISDRLAADLPVGLGVTELGGDNDVLSRMCEVGEMLRDEHRADVVVMGCAGMAQFQQPLERALGIPVVEPTRAATAMALGAVLTAG